MITNERQYLITQKKIQEFNRALADTAKTPPSGKMHPRAREAMRSGIESQLQDLEDEIDEYEKLKSGRVRSIVVHSIVGIALSLIKARIARNLTQKQLADRLGLPEQQIQRYESTQYKGVAVERLQEVADALEVRVKDVMTME
jgi:DNA-binding Xre family transcriptional regulator